jgi:hypothetical protein
MRRTADAERDTPGSSAGIGLFERGDVELPHLEHHVGSPFGLLRIGSSIICMNRFGMTCQDKP